MRIATFKKCDPDKASIKYTTAADVAEPEELAVHEEKRGYIQHGCLFLKTDTTIYGNCAQQK